MNAFTDNFEIYRKTVISQNMALKLMQQRMMESSDIYRVCSSSGFI